MASIFDWWVSPPTWAKAYFTQFDKRLSDIEISLKQIEQELEQMGLDLTQLTAQVAATETVEQSAITLLTELASEIQDNANDPVAIAALGQRLQNSAASLAAAVIANTPPAPPAANTP